MGRFLDMAREFEREHGLDMVPSPGTALPQNREAVQVPLAKLRPYLSANLQRLPDDDLLKLVNWDILRAWKRMLREMRGANGE